jgi:hypothetical protein
MVSRLHRIAWRGLAAVVLLVLGSATAAAQDHAVVDGIRIYLGVVPVSAMSPAERQMHGGVPSAPGQYHVMVALYDDASGKRITDATVRARVTSAAGASREKDLEAMSGPDAMSYGNYVAMPEAGDYKVILDIYRPGHANVVVARLDYRR